MSRMAKITILGVLVAVTGSGCGPKRGTASPEDYFPLIQVGLQGGEVAAMIGRNEAIKAKNYAGCVAADVLTSAFQSAGSALGGRLDGEVVIPGFELDMTECFMLIPTSGDASEASLRPITLVTMTGGDWYEPEATETPATETPATETPATETPAEVPVTMDSVREGNTEAAALVEGIAGVAIIAGTHYANKIKATDCKKGTVALEVLGYLSGMVKPIADELAAPDGKVSVPAVTVDTSACGG